MTESFQEKVPTPIQLQIVSHTPGRIRLRVSQEYRQPQAIAQIVRMVQAAGSEAYHLKSNVRTGSITLYYPREQGSVNDILSVLQDVGIIIDNAPSVKSPAVILTNTVASLNQQVERTTSGSLDLRFLVPLIFGGFALRQLFSKGSNSKIVPWYALAWYAFDTFMKFHNTNQPPKNHQPPELHKPQE